MKVEDYTDLITSAHRDSPKFVGSVRASIEPLVAIGNALAGTITTFDLERATGDQLDILGRWIGLSRRAPIKLTGVYFSWDDTVETGWNAGRWMGVGDSPDGVTELANDEYRTLLMLKVAANRWDGTAGSLQEMLDTYLAHMGQFDVVDTGDMSVEVQIRNANMSTVERQLLQSGIIPLKSAGIAVTYRFI